MDYFHGAPERKFGMGEAPLTVTEGSVVSGYASVFGRRDSGGDTVQKGAFTASLKDLERGGRQVKMLWQHDPTEPIGVWEEVVEDARGLKVRGRILTDLMRGREAAALIAAGALDGLSVGYRTKQATPDGKGGRILTEIDLWEVSLVTFPMLSDARIGQKTEDPEAGALDELAEALTAACGALRPD